MDDRNPRKLLLCARDIFIGIMLPWNIMQEHADMIADMRARLEEGVETRIDDAGVIALLDDAVALATELTTMTNDVASVYGRYDRARLTLAALSERARALLREE